MYHFDIPKTRQYDTGKVEVIARSSVGEAVATTELKVVPRHDDYRSVLKNAPRRKYLHASLCCALIDIDILYSITKKYLHNDYSSKMNKNRV